jgi:hypothetical protein
MSGAPEQDQAMMEQARGLFAGGQSPMQAGSVQAKSLYPGVPQKPSNPAVPGMPPQLPPLNTAPPPMQPPPQQPPAQPPMQPPGGGMPPLGQGMQGLNDAQRFAAFKGGAQLPMGNANTPEFKSWMSNTAHNAGGNQSSYDPYTQVMRDGSNGGAQSHVSRESLGINLANPDAMWQDPQMLRAWGTTDPAVAKQKHMAALAAAAPKGKS